MKKVAIIGAGIAGLSAGIFASRAGFETTIYEKNKEPGGNCSSWSRDGYTIDNCLHWLTGTNPGTFQNKLWRELGVLNDDTKYIRRDSFYTSELNGQTITLWRDIERTREEMLALSPEDQEEINAFIDCTSFVNDMLTSGKSPRDIIRVFTEAEFNLPKIEFTRFFLRYLGLNSNDWAKKFKHPLLQSVILDFMAKEYESYWLIVAYCFFAYENGDLVDGGSKYLVDSLVNTYLNEGGILKLSSPVDRLMIDKQRRTYRLQLPESIGHALSLPDSIEHTISLPEPIEHALARQGNERFTVQKVNGLVLANGKKIYCNYVIACCDINYTYRHLLKNKYTPKQMVEYYKHSSRCPIFSSFQVAYAVDGLLEEIHDTYAVECTPFEVAFQNYHRITIKNYRCYGDYIAPEGKTVIQVSLPQYEKDYDYWKKMYSNKALYNLAKENIALLIQNRIIDAFPEYEGKLKLLDAWTPYSYAKRNNNYQGAYMRFITTPFSRYAFMSSEIKDLENLYLANHWLRYPGGVPSAAYLGKLVVDMIVAKENDK